MDKLPNGWKRKQIGEITTKVVDGSHNPPKDKGAGIPMISAQNVINGKVNLEASRFITDEEFSIEQKRVAIQIGDILLTIVGTIGRSAVINNIDRKFAIQRSIAVIRTLENPYFVNYYFQSPQFIELILINARGAAQQGLYLGQIKALPILIPTFPEQTRIVNKLDGLFERIDKSIDLLEENIKHTEALMASVLDDVFGNGDTRIGDLCTICPKKSEIRDLEDLEVSFLPMTDLKEHQITFEPKQTKRISEVYTGYTYFNDDDVLLAKVTPCFENGKAGIAKNLTNGIGFGSSEYHVLRANKNTLPEWIYYSIMTAKFKEEGVNNMTGSSGLKRVPPAFVANWRIKNPPINEQHKIIERIKSTDSKLSKLISEQQSKLSYLRALKASLLDKAFKGKL